MLVEAINWTTVLVSGLAALFTGLPAIIVALRTHDAVNHRMDEMLLIARLLAGAEATLAEKLAQYLREGDLARQQLIENERRQTPG